MLVGRIKFGLQAEPVLDIGTAVSMGLAAPGESPPTGAGHRIADAQRTVEALASALGHRAETLRRNYLGSARRHALEFGRINRRCAALCR
jgi:hypothetical protein